MEDLGRKLLEIHESGYCHQQVGPHHRCKAWPGVVEGTRRSYVKNFMHGP